MMKDFKDEWDSLFAITLLDIKIYDSREIKIEVAQVLTVGGKKLVSGSKVIIDDILLWCIYTTLLMTYFKYVCKIFLKYRVSFRLDKYEFMKPRAEYVGHDIPTNDNCPAASKFDMINDWLLPTSCQTLFSFIGLVNFYHWYAPYMEL